MASITEALTELKRNPLQAVQKALIESVCREEGYHWRDRLLPPAVTIGLFIQQVLQGNACCQAVKHIAKNGATGSAWCQARARLPLAVFRKVLRKVHDALLPKGRPDDHLWRGHRTFHIDGTGVTLWDSPALRAAFGLPGGVKPGCGFPVAHLLTLFNAHNGLLVDVVAAPARRGDLADVPALLEHLQPGDILVGDESFGGYGVLALLQRHRIHGVFPLAHMRIVDFTPHRDFSREDQRDTRPGVPHTRWLRQLGHRDQLVEYFKPSHVPPWITPALWAQLPDTLVVRELRRQVYHPKTGMRELTTVTTLLDPQAYPARALTELRGARWGVETNIGHLKTTLKMDMLHCRTPEGVRKELCTFALVYNLVRAVMLAAARRQKVPPQRISFADALHWLQFVRPGERLAVLLVLPRRPHRIEPRVQKRRNKEYPYMTKPRANYKNDLRKRKKTA
jgi:hypothetical protein